MPTGKDGDKYFERLVKLEVKVSNLMTWQKWELTLLAGIILLLVKVALSK